MADGTYRRDGLQALMQDHLSDRLVDTTVNAMPLMMFMFGKDGTKKPGAFGMGRPKSGAVITGVPMSNPKRQAILGSNRYEPIINTENAEETDGKAMGQRDTLPERVNGTVNHTTSSLVRAFSHWTEYADPIEVWNKDVQRTRGQNGGSGPKANAAVGELFTFETQKVLSTHITRLNSKLWTAATAPTNVNSDPWDNIYSISAALDTDNVYMGIDRASSANSFWRSNRITAHQGANLPALVHDALYGTPALADVGHGLDLLICGPTLFPLFKEQARKDGAQIIIDGKLPGIGEFGFTREVVRFGNTWVLMDPACPSTGRGADKNVVVGLDLSTWTIAFSPNANFTVSEPFNLAKIPGGKDATVASLRTELMVVCECPRLNVYWEDVG